MGTYQLGTVIDIPMGTTVEANITENFKVRGIIVGKAGTDIMQSHIVMCTDDQLPNDEYQYTTFIVGLPMITVL